MEEDSYYSKSNCLNKLFFNYLSPLTKIIKSNNQLTSIYEK